MKTLALLLVLSCPLGAAAAPQSVTDLAQTQLQDQQAAAQAQRQAYLQTRRAELLGFETYQPRHANVRELIEAAHKLTERSVTVGVIDERGEWTGDRRDRLFEFGSAVGIQEFEQGRKDLIALLGQLDGLIGELNGAEAGPSDSFVRVVQLRSLEVGSAIALVQSIIGDVQIEVVPESRSIVLRGTTERVARAESLLREVDLPAPQFTLQCMVIGPSQGDGDASLPAELTQGLTELTGVAGFARLGNLMVRGSVDGTARIGVSSELAGLGRADGRSARLQLEAEPIAYDAQQGLLTLRDLQLEIERPDTGPAGSPAASDPTVASQQSRESWSREVLRTDLSLRNGEYTVVGSLGSQSLFLVLRFSAE